MTSNPPWTLPVPSTALLGGGPVFEIRPKRDVAIRYSYEAANDERREEALVFQGVESFKCTYYNARDASMREAYDKLVNCGESSWLQAVRTNLETSGDDARGLLHLMINFDDGPAYEVICRSFRSETI